jgi:hypothetical protein
MAGPVIIMLIAALVMALMLLMALEAWQSQALAWASAVRSWYPPVINNTLECPQGYVVTPENESGLYMCGPCLAYLYPNGSLTISCPR